MTVPIQRISFDRMHLDGVRSGEKTSTARFRDPAQIGPALLTFDQSPEPDIELAATVTAVEACLVSEITDVDARSGGSADREAYIAVLRFHYPRIHESDEIEIVRFSLTEKSTR